MFKGWVEESLKERKKLVSEAREPEDSTIMKDQGGGRRGFYDDKMVTMANVTEIN